MFIFEQTITFKTKPKNILNQPRLVCRLVLEDQLLKLVDRLADQQNTSLGRLIDQLDQLVLDNNLNAPHFACLPYLSHLIYIISSLIKG